MTNGALYRVGGQSLVGILFLLDSEGWISCSTESFSAVPSAVCRFCIIMKPVEAIRSVLLQGNDAKCHGTALEEGTLVGRFIGYFRADLETCKCSPLQNTSRRKWNLVSPQSDLNSLRARPLNFAARPSFLSDYLHLGVFYSI